MTQWPYLTLARYKGQVVSASEFAGLSGSRTTTWLMEVAELLHHLATVARSV